MHNYPHNRGHPPTHIQLQPPLFQVMSAVSRSPMKPAFVFLVTYFTLWKAAVRSVQSRLFHAEQGSVPQTPHTGPVLQPHDHLDGIWQVFCCCF